MTNANKGAPEIYSLKQINQIRKESKIANNLIGTKKLFFENLPALKLKQHPIYKISNMISKYISIVKPELVFIPSSNDILDTVKKNFKFDKMELFLASNRNYLFKTIDKSKQQFIDINNEKVNYVVYQKEKILKKIKDIKKIKESLETQEVS